MPHPAVMWFRQDLRLADNPALAAAAQGGRPILPVYILDDEAAGRRRPGGAGRWWLHHSLQALTAALRRHGLPLILRRGRAGTVLAELVRETAAEAVVWNRCYEPFAIERDTAIKRQLKAQGVAADSFNAALWREPWTIATRQGEPFKVFTPFWRALQEGGPPAEPHPLPRRLPALDGLPPSDRLEDWRLLPTRPDWAGGLRDSWIPGEAAAQRRLAQFLDQGLGGYRSHRDRPDLAGTSRLSPHLHWGELGPRQIWHAVRVKAESLGGSVADGSPAAFLRQLGWREFIHHLLYHWPRIAEEPWRPAFAAFPWRDDPAALAAWQSGRTGSPIVVAGMRELWHTGWMHNRVRMIAASFLVKDLLVPWQQGERWFWDTLVDADLAQNAANWQWVAGCGADAAPVFRIFNPVHQGERFDPSGDYVRRWVPELAGLPGELVHKPWTAPESVLAAAGVTLGRNFPRPIVDHAAARARALASFRRVQGGDGG